MQMQSYLTHEIGTSAICFADMSNVESDIRLIRDLVQWADTNVNQIAKRIGVANTTLNRFANGSAKGRLHRDTIAKLRATYPDFPGFEVEPDLPSAYNSADYVAIEILPSYAGMGGGGSGDDDPGRGLVPRALVEDELRAKPTDFLLIETRGESMMPDFQHGDQILIDKRDTNPVQPGSFALWDGDGYVIKLVERVPQRNGFYRIFSANGRYSAYEVEADQVKIMGRPVWFARRL